MVGKFVKAWFAAQSSLVALNFGNPMMADPTVEMPYVTYQVISSDIPASLTKGHVGLHYWMVQLDIVARSYESLATYAQTIIGIQGSPGLAGFTGTMGEVKVKGVSFQNRREYQDEPAQGETHGPYRIQLDFKICTEEVA